MFKRGQLVRSNRNGKSYVILGRTIGFNVWAAHVKHINVGFWLNTKCLKLIGNNYKAKEQNNV